MKILEIKSFLIILSEMSYLERLLVAVAAAAAAAATRITDVTDIFFATTSASDF